MDNVPPDAKAPRDAEKKREAMRLANLSSVGFALVICTFIGYGIGYFIDKHFHTGLIFTIVFLLLGIAAGFVNIFRSVRDNS